MPDESCRKCGGLLLEYLICANCREIVQFICRICGYKNHERFHDGFCFSPKNQQVQNVMPLISK
jgi:predicted amidophosphoribosyltransferase